MHKKIGIVITALLLLCIVAVPWHIRDMRIKEEKTKQEITEVYQVNLMKLNKDIVTRVEIKDKNLLVLKKQEGAWKDSEFEALPYHQEAVQNMISAVCSLQSTQVIRNVQDEKKYGISEDSRMITLYDETNNAYSIRLGSLTADKNSLYIAAGAEKTVYIADGSKSELLFQTRDDFIEKQLIMPQKDTVDLIEIGKKDERKLRMIKNPIGGHGAYDTWSLENFYKTPHTVSTEMTESLINQMMGFEKTGVVGEKTGDLAPYGLDRPEFFINLNNSWVIKFGKKENGLVYFIYSKEPYVYRIPEEKLKGLFDIKPIAVIRKEVYIPDFTRLQNVTLSDPAQNIVLDLKEQKEGVGAPLLTSTVGEIQFNTEKTKALLQLIIENICIEAELQNPEIEEKQERKAEITIAYHFKDGTDKVIELLPYDNNFYILRFEGNIEFAVGKEKIMGMLSKFHEESKKVNNAS